MKAFPVGAGGAFLLLLILSETTDVCGFPKKLGKLPKFNLGMSGRVDTLSPQVEKAVRTIRSVSLSEVPFWYPSRLSLI